MITLQSEDPHGGTLRDLAPDLTPMLDILFILLVFFLLTVGTVFKSLDLKLPSAVEEELTQLNEPRHIMLEIREGSYALDGEQMDNFIELKTALRATLAEKPDYELIVAGDRRIAIERLLRVLTYLQMQGIDAANILMQKETNP
ncbi:biopolymer transporter ExbD [uncultured Sneathiella sp.]|jgi:biopolymer transport protein ExbD|uniref:ExbD/TolR family protein n=1 Tax=uncultured Sneathiella sp. TaxID=879315 RepID=UPI0030D9D018|tara:strand:+ start:324 stop:755 length:432 start_codon:yes stop_codon:yes gene_type:complete